MQNVEVCWNNPRSLYMVLGILHLCYGSEKKLSIDGGGVCVCVGGWVGGGWGGWGWKHLGMNIYSVILRILNNGRNTGIHI